MSPEYAREWVRKAEADRAAAKRALSDSRRRADQAEIACYHAQQCAEKYLKAMLAMRGGPIPRIHDLPALVRALAGSGLPSSRLRADILLLNQFGVEIRYPGTSATRREAGRAVRAMERTATTCARLIGRRAP